MRMKMRIGKTGIGMLITKIVIFIKSLWFHIYHGLPKSSQDEINYRYNICLACDFYSHNDQECLQCGCNVNNKKIFMNKLAWADQHCPINKWSKIEK